MEIKRLELFIGLLLFVTTQLFLSIDTIKFHIKNIYHKLQVNNRASFLEKYKK